MCKQVDVFQTDFLSRIETNTTNSLLDYSSLKICEVDKNIFFCNMEISHYTLLQIVQFYNWISVSLKHDHRLSPCLLYLFLLTEWISKFILGKVQKRHWSIHGAHQDTESIKGPEGNKGPSLFSTSFINAKGQYNKMLHKNLGLSFIITATTAGTTEVGQQEDRVMDSRSPCADVPLETARRKVAVPEHTCPWHG